MDIYFPRYLFNLVQKNQAKRELSLKLELILEGAVLINIMFCLFVPYFKVPNLLRHWLSSHVLLTSMT